MIETGVSYFGNRMIEHYIKDLEDMINHGCTYVVHTYSENDLAFFRGTMERLFRATRDAGLGGWADPWGAMGLFGGEAFSEFVAKNPETLQILNTGFAAPAACPNHPLTHANMKKWINAAVESGADTIFWDEPHFYIVGWDSTYVGDPDAWACRCGTCLHLYQERYGEEMPIELTSEVHAFRKQSLASFLNEMSAYAKKMGVQNAICVLPTSENSMEGLDWQTIANIPSIDIFGTDPYWYLHDREVKEYVGEQTARVVNICKQNEKRPHIWVQAFRVPAGREEEIATALQCSANGGAEVLAAWGFGGCAVISSIASDRPEIVWEVIGRSFNDLHRLGT